MMVWAAVFLKLVEPRIDGLPRVVAACERTHRFVESSPANEDQRHLACKHAPVHMLVKWSRLVERPLKLNFDRDDNDNDSCLYIASLYDEIEESRRGTLWLCAVRFGLEAWDDPALAAGFVFALMEEKLDPPHAPPSLWTWATTDAGRATGRTATRRACLWRAAQDARLCRNRVASTGYRPPK